MDALMITAKYPRPGHVKTRLGRDIGMDESAGFSRALLEDRVESAGSNFFNPVIVANPGRDAEDFRKDYPLTSVYAGASNKLIYKVADAVRHAYQDLEADKLLITPSDAVIPPETINEYFESLDSQAVVLGPSAGGRFNALGFNQHFGRHLSQGVGSEPGFFGTAYALVRGLASFPSIAVGSPTYDVDTLDDLRMAMESVPESFHRTRAFAEKLELAPK